MTTWIYLSQQRPEKETPVLVALTSHDHPRVAWLVWQSADWESGQPGYWYWEDLGDENFIIEGPEVYAWAELPELPEFHPV